MALPLALQQGYCHHRLLHPVLSSGAFSSCVQYFGPQHGTEDDWIKTELLGPLPLYLGPEIPGSASIICHLCLVKQRLAQRPGLRHASKTNRPKSSGLTNGLHFIIELRPLRAGHSHFI